MGVGHPSWMRHAQSRSALPSERQTQVPWVPAHLLLVPSSSASASGNLRTWEHSSRPAHMWFWSLAPCSWDPCLVNLFVPSKFRGREAGSLEELSFQPVPLLRVEQSQPVGKTLWSQTMRPAGLGVWRDQTALAQNRSVTLPFLFFLLSVFFFFFKRSNSCARSLKVSCFEGWFLHSSLSRRL